MHVFRKLTATTYRLMQLKCMTNRKMQINVLTEFDSKFCSISRLARIGGLSIGIALLLLIVEWSVVVVMCAVITRTFGHSSQSNVSEWIYTL